MKENWRATLPLPVIVTACAITYAISYLVDVMAYYADVTVPPEMPRIRMLMLGVLSIAQGGFRGSAFHPAQDTAYWRWLALTPWSSDKPLPEGPVHLIWTDAVVLAVLSLLAYSNIVTLAAVPIVAFLGAYLVLLSFTLYAGQTRFLVAVLFLAPLTYYPFKDIFIAGFVLVGLYILVSTGTHRFLRGFPWNTGYWKADLVEQLRENAVRHNVIGWPFKPLCIFEASGVKVRTAFVLSLLVTWWVHVLLWAKDIPYTSDLTALLAVLALFMALFRFIVYHGSYSPPISLLGRIVTGRLIIPRYDKMFVAPLCTILAGALLPVVLGRCGLNVEWSIKVSLFVALFLTFALPPTLKTWRLTGAYQITRPVLRSQTRGTAGQDQNVGGLFSQRLTTSR